MPSLPPGMYLSQETIFPSLNICQGLHLKMNIIRNFHIIVISIKNNIPNLMLCNSCGLTPSNYPLSRNFHTYRIKLDQNEKLEDLHEFTKEDGQDW